MAKCDVPTLVSRTSGFANMLTPGIRPLARVALLTSILQRTQPSFTPNLATINSLLASAKCFTCLSPGEQQVMKVQLLCEILNAPGSGVTPNVPSSNILFWYRADAGVYSDAGVTPAVNNGTVQQWNDQSGNNRNLSQATPASRPTYLTGVNNGLPAVQFKSGGSPTSMANGAVGAPQPFTVFAVIKVDQIDGSGQSILIFTGAAPFGTSLGTWSVGSLTIAGGTFTGTYLFTFVENGGSSILRINGVQVAAGNCGTAAAFSGLTLANSAGATTETVEHLEVIGYSGQQSSSVIASVEAYLAAKYTGI